MAGEQSGHIEAVGFELYTTMLERTVRELKGEIAGRSSGGAVESRAEHSHSRPITLRKRISGCECTNEWPAWSRNRNLKMLQANSATVTARLRRRYAICWSTPTLKLLSQRIGVAQIERRRDAVSIRFTEKATVDPERLAQFVANEPGSQFTPAGVLKFSLKEKQPEQVLGRLKSLLEELAGEAAGR